MVAFDANWILSFPHPRLWCLPRISPAAEEVALIHASQSSYSLGEDPGLAENDDMQARPAGFGNNVSEMLADGLARDGPRRLWAHHGEYWRVAHLLIDRQWGHEGS